MNPLCTNSQRPWRNGWQLVCCTGEPIAARTWARNSGDSMCAPARAGWCPTRRARRCGRRPAGLAPYQPRPNPSPLVGSAPMRACRLWSTIPCWVLKSSSSISIGSRATPSSGTFRAPCLPLARVLQVVTACRAQHVHIHLGGRSATRRRTRRGRDPVPRRLGHRVNVPNGTALLAGSALPPARRWARDESRAWAVARHRSSVGVDGSQLAISRRYRAAQKRAIRAQDEPQAHHAARATGARAVGRHRRYTHVTEPDRSENDVEGGSASNAPEPGGVHTGGRQIRATQARWLKEAMSTARSSQAWRL